MANKKKEEEVLGTVQPAVQSNYSAEGLNSRQDVENALTNASYQPGQAVNDAAAALKECEKILTEDAANVYIQDMASLVALNKKFAGYEFYPLYVQDMAKIYRVED